MKKKKQKGAWKRPVASVLGMVLVIGLTIVGTLAFLQTESNTKTNVFTGSNDIKLYLEEPAYNLRQNSDNTYTVKNTSSPDPREYVPGIEYPKNPMLYNTTGKQKKKSDGTEEFAQEWVAMRVDYGIDVGEPANQQIDTGEEKSYANMIADYEVTGNSATKMGIIEPIVFDVDRTVEAEDGNETTVDGGWIQVPDSMLPKDVKYDIYVYKYKLEAAADVTADDGKTVAEIESTLVSKAKAGTSATNLGSRTSPLFEKIVIKDQEQLLKNGYEINDLRFFSIKLSGAAIKVMPTINIEQIVKDDLKSTSTTQSKIIVEDLVSLLTD